MKYILVIFCLFLTLSVKADINNIPPQDLKDIKYLIENLVLEDDFAYPIFGTKPMALADFGLAPSPNRPLRQVHARLKSQLFVVKHKRRLSAWYKHKNEFSFKDFVVLDNERDLFKNAIVFVLINKKNLLRVLKENETIFKQELGNSFTPELFLTKLEKRETSLAQAIHNNHGLLGIMLGYGVRNSMLFQEKIAVLKQIDTLKGILKKDSALHKKYHQIYAKLQSFNEFEEFSAVMPLHFGSDNAHEETIALRNQYKADQQKIAELMSQPNFIDRVLERLMS